MSEIVNENLVGQRFGSLTVMELYDYIHYGRRTKRQWLCKCDCGNLALVMEQDLKSGHTKSCGCLKKKK